jgi:TRAP-type mannitol/chloroaromatic compound transport system permease large subunit
MLASLYVLWIIINAKLRPGIAPPLSAEDRRVSLPKFAEVIARTRRNVVAGLIGALKGKRNADVPLPTLVNHLVITLLPALAAGLLMGSIYLSVTAPDYVVPSELQEMGFAAEEEEANAETEDLEDAGGLREPPAEDGQKAPAAAGAAAESPKASAEAQPDKQQAAEAAPAERKPVPTAYWVTLAIVAAGLVVFYAIFTFVRLEIFKMLLASFFPLALLILGVLGSIVVGLATPTEAAAMGSFGGFVLAAAYRQLTFGRVKESVFLCAKTSAMVCWLFVGSSIFAAAFALLGGQEIINVWVKSLDMTPVQFMILAQVIIFLLGWPLEWTEIIVIFMPIFIPLLSHFSIDPLFFGLLVALNLQTAFLSPPVAMAAFHLKGVAPPHVTLNQIFIGMMPYMAIQVLALILLYLFPAIGLWLPSLVYQAG